MAEKPKKEKKLKVSEHAPSKNKKDLEHMLNEQGDGTQPDKNPVIPGRCKPLKDVA